MSLGNPEPEACPSLSLEGAGSSVQCTNVREESRAKATSASLATWALTPGPRRTHVNTQSSGQAVGLAAETLAVDPHLTLQGLGCSPEVSVLQRQLQRLGSSHHVGDLMDSQLWPQHVPVWEQVPSAGIVSSLLSGFGAKSPLLLELS